MQICATATEQYEHQMEQIKRIAFRKCFPQSPCTSERIAFDDCFHSSLNAVRAHRMQAHHHSDNFMDTAERYRDAVDDCFLDDDLPASFPDLSAFVVDEDAVYARIVYGMEFADRLWGLPQVAVSTSLLDPKSVCLVRETVGRIFGNGISRTIDSADPQFNNLNTSCIVDDTQVQCYQRFLQNDDQFQFLIITKDRAMRACIQSVRLQTQCRTGDSSRLRVCLCSAREEFENRMQSSILQCSKNLNLSSIHDYRIYIDKSKQFTKYYPSKPSQIEFTDFKAFVTEVILRNADCMNETNDFGHCLGTENASLIVFISCDSATEIQPDVLLQGVQFDGIKMPQNSIPSNIVLDPKPSRPYFEIVQGTNLNGQCLCACERPTTLPNNQPRNLPLADHRSQPKSNQQTFLSTAQARPPQWMSPNGARPNWKPWYRAEVF
ncbi:unnamed protein product [Anisakis simplex]|uniref:Uncharacterized protein n=1 Tax=Anisakis simplex TaxID=6269 RepID=A0A3P6R3N4_ANISI|nr:unnamed protein product [Anisakis simplex]